MAGTDNHRRNRVFKSLHKPLTYLGVERTFFFFVGVSAVAVSTFSSLCSPELSFSWEATRSVVGRQTPIQRCYSLLPRVNASACGTTPLSRKSLPLRSGDAAHDTCNQAMEGIWGAQRSHQSLWLLESGDLPHKEWGPWTCAQVRGVDHESLDQKAQEYAVKRLEAAMKVFGPGFHVYQYLFKTS